MDEYMLYGRDKRDLVRIIKEQEEKIKELEKELALAYKGMRIQADVLNFAVEVMRET